jgi:hypothetical protein
VPPRWRQEVERILIPERRIAVRVRELSRQIERDFTGDSRITEFSRRSWRETAREARHSDGRDGFGFAFAEYERVTGRS